MFVVRILGKYGNEGFRQNAVSRNIKTVRSYEGESNENLKSAIKIGNTTQFSCKLTTMIIMVCRVTDRWQYDAGMQHDGAVVV